MSNSGPGSLPPPQPPPGGWQQPGVPQPAAPQQGWQQQQQGWQQQPRFYPGSTSPQVVVVKQRNGCLTAVMVVIGIVAVAGLGLFLLFAFAVNEAAENLSDSVGVAAPSDYQVVLTSCTTDSFSDAKATGTIVNRSTKRQGFSVTVRFTTSDNTLIAEDSAHVDTLDVGQTGTWTAISFKDAPPDVKCAIGSVNYTIFDNEG